MSPTPTAVLPARRPGKRSRHDLDRLEDRKLFAADTVQALPFRLDFDADRGELVDKDGQGTGFTRVQANRNANQYQPALIDLVTAGGTGELKITTTGTSAAGSSAGVDNTQVNALETQFDGRVAGFTVETRLLGPLSYIDQRYEQAGVFFGPDQDNWVKLVAIRNYNGQFLEFSDETSDANGNLSSQRTGTAAGTAIGNFAQINTLDLRLVGDFATGKVSAYYRVNSDTAAYTKVPYDITVSAAKKAAFYNAASRGGIMAAHKNDVGSMTARFDYFQLGAGTTVAARPSVLAVRPADGATGVSRNVFVATDVTLPNVGGGVDPATLTSTTVKLTRQSDGQQVTANLNTTGGGDAIVLQPTVTLDANTTYVFTVTDGVKDTTGAAFLPFSSTFTTGTQAATSDSSVAFSKQVQGITQGTGWTGFAWGKDGRLYASSDAGVISRFDVGADGKLANRLDITTIVSHSGEPRLITGIAFAPNSTAANPVLFVSHGWYGFNDAPDWTGKLTKLTGPALGTAQDVVVGLPRSLKDHLNNQPAFGPDGKLYFSQASMTAMGAPDSTWGLRAEHLMTGAILQVDVNAIGTGTVNVRTSGVANPYNPFASGAPVKLYATGVRNAYDLVWTADGKLYAPTNGSAAGGNAPASPNPNDGGDRTDLGVNGPYDGTVSPGINTVNETQSDFLFRIQSGGYYGSPNPLRDEYVLNGGNPTAGYDSAQVGQYPVGTQPDRNYRGFAFDFGKNYSANGIIQYQGNAFNNALNGKLLITRYSGGDDVIVLTPGADGNIVEAQSGIAGLTGFVDPLDLIQDPVTGNVYVAEYGAQRITLATPVLSGGQISVDQTNLYFADVTETVNAGQSPSVRVRVTNTGTGLLALASDALVLGGTNAGDFVIASGTTALPRTLKPGETADVYVAFRAKNVGLRNATLTIKSNDSSNPNTVVNLRGLGAAGDGGSGEPSLQRVLQAWGLQTNVGDDDPNTTAYPLNPSASSDEVVGPRLVKSGANPVTIELLGNFANKNDNGISSRVGWYESGSPSSRTKLFDVGNAYSQSLAPQINSGGQLTFDPGTGTFSLYAEFPAFKGRLVTGEDGLNTWESNSARQRKVRLYALKDAGGNVVPNAYVFTFEEYNVEYDQNDVVGIIRGVSVAPAGPEIGLENLDAVPGTNRLVMSRIRELDANFPNQFKDKSTFRIRNTGTGALNVSGLSISNGDFTILSGGGAFSLAPGATRDVTVQFVYNRAGNGNEVRTATLTIQSDDADESSRPLTLAGLWQSHSEDAPGAGTQEPVLGKILEAFGYNVNAGNVNTGGQPVRVGQEILTGYFRHADSKVDVSVRMLAAYHQQKATTNSLLRWFVSSQTSGGTTLYKHDARFGQSLLPTIDGSLTAPAVATFAPGVGTPFGFRVDSHWQDSTKNATLLGHTDPHAFRIYAALGADGKPIANTYLVCQDYTGASYSNYDYQDNIYLVTGVRPESGPSAPANLAASANGGGVALTWTKNGEGNLAGANVYRRVAGSGGAWVKLNAQYVTGNGYTDTTALAGTSYEYEVRAFDYHGTQGTASAVTATRTTDTLAPTAPTNLAGSGTSSGVQLYWLDGAEADLAGFNVYRSATPGGTFVKLNGGLLADGSFLDTGAPAGVVSYYRVTAVDYSGNESAAATLSVTRPGTGSPPAAPSGLVAAASGSGITLGWTDNSTNESNFAVERRDASGVWTQLGQVGANVTTFTDNAAQAGVTYTYRVRATSASGASAYTNEAGASVSLAVPAQPTNPAAVALGPQSVRVTWTDASSNEVGFRVERRPLGGAWAQLATVGANVVTFTDNTVLPNSNWEYRVRAYNAAGDGPSSDAVQVSTPVADAYTSVNVGTSVPGGTTVLVPGKDYDVVAGGRNVWEASDEFRFVYKSVAGDFDYQVRVIDLQGPNAQAMAGLMARFSLSNNSANAFIRSRPIGARFNYRATAGGATVGAGEAAVSYPNSYVRLQRVGNTFTGYHSADGAAWTTVGTVTIAGAPTSVFLGLAVSAHDTANSGATATARFRDLIDRNAGTATPPAPASGLAATPNAAGQAPRVTLGWADNATNEAGFLIERKTGTSGAWVPVATVGANVTVFADTTVAGSTTYQYRVVALGAAGAANAAASNVVSATTPAAPSINTYASVNVGTTGGYTTVVTPNRDYDVAGGGTDVYNASDQFRFVYKSITGNFDYSVRVTEVVASDPYAMGGLMARASLNPNSANAFVRSRPVGARFNWRADNGGATGAQGAGAVSYPNSWVRLVRVGNTFTGYHSVDGQTWAQLHSVTMNNMPTTVFIGMAVSARTQTASSATALAKFRDLTDRNAAGALAAPANLTASPTVTSSGSAVDVAWTDQTAAEDGFVVQRNANSGAWVDVATLQPNATSFVDAAVQAGQTYSYRVVAVGPVENSPASNEATVTVAAAAPNAPANLAAQNVDGKVRLTWTDASDNEAYFQVERRLAGAADWSALAVVAANTVEHLDATVGSSATYSYRARALGTVADSAWSAEANVTTPAATQLGSANVGGATGTTTVDDPSGTAFTLTAENGATGGTADALRLAYRELAGDFDVRVKLTAATGLAGLTVRAGLSAEARNVFLSTVFGGASLTTRETTGGETVALGSATAGPWLRLTRAGYDLVGYTSADGATWAAVGAITLSLPQTLQVGLAATSGSAEFDELTFA